MCTILDKMELVRNLGDRSYARHRIWCGQHGQATDFRISEKVNKNKFSNWLSIGALRWGTIRFNLQGLRHEVSTLFQYYLHE